jgi:hypothetical protein
MGTAGGDIAATVVVGQPEARSIGFWLLRTPSSQRLTRWARELWRRTFHEAQQVQGRPVGSPRPSQAG